MAFDWPPLLFSSIISILHKTLISFCRNYGNMLISNFSALSLSVSMLSPCWCQCDLKNISSHCSSYRGLHRLLHKAATLCLIIIALKDLLNLTKTYSLLLSAFFPTLRIFSYCQSWLFLCHKTTKCSRSFHTDVLSLITYFPLFFEWD